MIFKRASLILACILLLTSCTMWIDLSDDPIVGEGLTVAFLDVGQADSIFVQCDGQAMLIDGGNRGDSDAIINFIEGSGFNTLSYLVATHAHEDHIGGLPEILRWLKSADSILLSPQAHTTKIYQELLQEVGAKKDSGSKVAIALSGKSFTLGGAVCTVLAPAQEKYKEINDSSVVIRIDYGTNSFLFMGDAEKLSEE